MLESESPTQHLSDKVIADSLQRVEEQVAATPPEVSVRSEGQQRMDVLAAMRAENAFKADESQAHRLNTLMDVNAAAEGLRPAVVTEDLDMVEQQQAADAARATESDHQIAA